MRNTMILLLAMLLAVTGCSSSDSASDVPQVGTAECSIDAQKQFVLDTMRDVYLWYEVLPANVDLSAYASPEELLAYLISFQPLDDFSFINSAVADQQFFGEGQYDGFGFSSKFLAADDLRFTRVFSDSPAWDADFRRGHRIVSIDGRTVAEIQANEGVTAVFGQPTLQFTLRDLDDTEYTSTVSKGLVTIDPLPQHRVIDLPSGGSVGYMELATFISTADATFDTIFQEFRLAGVTDVILDLRYNGGGLVSTTELLGDYMGGDVANNLVFSKTLFNDKNAASNRTRFFQRLTNSMSLSRLVVIATSGTASASELVTNSMEPHVEVSIVGGTTFGKPVGQLGIEFCDKILRPTSFESVNANDIGGYFDGLPVDCAAADDLSIAVGDDADPNVVTALSYLATGACPVASVPGQMKFEGPKERVLQLDLRGPASREFAGAF
jgi:hypothetical protein